MHVKRIHLTVDIENGDGSVSRYEVIGQPALASTRIQLDPVYDQRDQWGALTATQTVGAVDAMMETRLLPLPGELLFRVEELGRPVLVITESP